MLASLADNTIRQYNVTVRLWWQFCDNSNIDEYQYSKTHVLCFLAEQFNKGCSYGTLNCHRSALSLLLGDQVSSDDCIKRLLKGAYRQKPNKPKYSFTWDPQIVLNFISNWNPNLDLTLEKITKKIVMLLAICTAHRVQTRSEYKLPSLIS